MVFGPATIKVGDKEFTLETEYCQGCDSVGLTPDNFRQIDEWGNALPTNVAEFQPYLPTKIIAASERYAKQFGLKWAEFVKACTTFYLVEMTKEKEFKILRSEVLAEGTDIFNSAKQKVYVPVRYRLFKQLQLFAEVWELHETNVIEEALLFCVTVLESGMSHEAEKAEFQEFLEKFSMAS
ncbi:MAG: hypothetical protein NDI61_04395 [Bdellovibrionaceae bacterium]|nr:hypothetical protein [Pseudobdellovibrionaceae bacterium]